MLSSLFPWQQPISSWSLDRNPICVRGISRERLVSLQGCSLRKDESSLNFTMLLRLESLFPFSPPLVGGNIAVLGVILLDLTLVLCQSSRLLGFRILETWQSSLTLADFLILADFLGFLASWILYSLVVLCVSCSLPDSGSLPDSL
jgi:hypothetical protein